MSDDALTEYMKREFGTLSDLVTLHADLRGDKPALIDGDRVRTYAELNALADTIAAGLQRDGVTQGQSVAICGYNSLEYGLLFIGILRAGAVVAPLAPSTTPEGLVGMLEDCGATHFFVDESTEDALTHVRGQITCPILRMEVGVSGGFWDWLPDAAAKPVPVEVGPDDPFNIIYSSGTTGTPKGIVQPHKMRWAHISPGDRPGFGTDAVTLSATPLYSNTTLVAFLPTMAGGGTNVLMGKFNTLHYLELAQKHRVTHGMLVPVQYRRLMDEPRFDEFDLSSYRLKFCTSAPFSAELKREVLDRWPGGLVEYFGMTEGGGTCILQAHEFPDKLHTVGRPAPNHDIRVIDEDGNELPVGETGEIVGASRSMMNGYHNKPDKTSETEWFSPDGKRFLRSGDVGRFDEDGFMTIMDRKKDVIISGGFNIYPSDIEAVLHAEEGIADAAVVGVESRAWGETPIAFVVLEKGASLTPDAVKEAVNSKVGKTQRLADVILTDELPRSAIGKVLKRELRDSYTGTVA